jgi:hypothetical protein
MSVLAVNNIASVPIMDLFVSQVDLRERAPIRPLGNFSRFADLSTVSMQPDFAK